MTGKELKKQFVRYLKLQRGFSGNTLDAYDRDVEKLLDFLAEESLHPL